VTPLRSVSDFQTRKAFGAYALTQVDFPVPRGPKRKQLALGSCSFLAIMLPFILLKWQLVCHFYQVSFELRREGKIANTPFGSVSDLKILRHFRIKIV
jgi:hypothetical protein